MRGWRKLVSHPYGRVRRLLGRGPAPGRRRYIPASVGIEGFFGALNERGIRYAVLRWFEHLPHLEPGEDIDILFEDADLARAADLFASGPGGIPCDVYSAGGSPGSSQHGFPYFPPTAARKLLARTVEIGGRYRVPCPEDHFLSLAYHALYHKGLRSGLPTTLAASAPAAAPEHDYAAVLGNLAAAIGLTIPIDMESLDAFLGTRGWYPEPPVLQRLAARDAWIAARCHSADAFAPVRDVEGSRAI